MALLWKTKVLAVSNELVPSLKYVARNFTLQNNIRLSVPLNSHLNIDMIPSWMESHLFSKRIKEEAATTTSNLENAEEFMLPQLEGGSLKTHFQILGEKKAKPYEKLLLKLTGAIPRYPKKWILSPGWTCYSESSPPKPVSIPNEDALILDVEVCVKESSGPVLASAVSSNAWYLWVSPQVVHGHKTTDVLTLDDLIPLNCNSKKPRIVVGHNVMYDAARIGDSYIPQLTGLRYFDTMAAHVCVSGVTDLQKNILRVVPDLQRKWVNFTSSNSLGNVHKLYCGKEIDKNKRKIFLHGSLSDVNEYFQELSWYCAKDVVATHSVFCKILPLFLEMFPHPVTLSGILELSTVFLPVNGSWEKNYKCVEQTVSSNENELSVLFRKLADEACDLLRNETYKTDPWMWNQDWTIKESPRPKDVTPKTVKQQNLELEGGEVPPYEHNVDEETELLQERPQWYKNLCSSQDDAKDQPTITPAMLIAPKLMQLRWDSYPLHFIRGLGWGVLVPTCEKEQNPLVKSPWYDSLQSIWSQPIQQDKEYLDMTQNLLEEVENSMSMIRNTVWVEPGLITSIDLGGGLRFCKLPHALGFGKNVGSPLAKSVITNPALHSLNKNGQAALDIMRRLQVWTRFNDKLQNTPLVWNGDKRHKAAFVPNLVSCGDYKRQPKEDIFTPLLSSKDDVFSELKSALAPEEKFALLSASLKDLEMWIASIFSDGTHGKYASTSLGQMFLEDSYIAYISEVMNVSPSQSKLLSFAVLYGASRGFIAKLMRNFDVKMSRTQALGRADRLLEHLRGKNELQGWQNGLYSELLNKLDELLSVSAVTPILCSRLSRALDQEMESLRSLKRNWVVQSSKTDFLHLILCCFSYLEPTARLCTVDCDIKLCFIIKANRKYQAAKSLHIAHLYAKAFFVSQMGFTSIPSSAAFLPYVQIKHSLGDESAENISIFDAVLMSEQKSK